MKRSKCVTLGLVMSAMIVTGCIDQRRCVDTNGIVIADEACKDEEKSSSSSSGTTGTTVHSGPHWYYGGRGTGLGSKVSGGTTSPGIFGRVARGGFGSLASFHGSGS